MVSVSVLGNVQTLDLMDLFWCTGITDVSMLGNVPTLDLFGCTGITDVSMLCNVQTLANWHHGCEYAGLRRCWT